MPRQRLRARSSTLARVVGGLLAALLALALAYYGVLLALLALKALPADDVDAISGYRTAFDWLAELDGATFSDTTRIVLAAAGAVAVLFFGLLALRAIPRPYLARHEHQLDASERGTTTVAPRAIERVAEAAAVELAGVASASGRYGTHDLSLGVELRRARDVADTLDAVQHAVVEALGRHGLPVVPVHLTLTGFERRTRRELE